MKVLQTYFFLPLGLALLADADLDQWNKFKNHHGKFYTNRSEENLRYEVFRSNLQKIQEHNAEYEAGESSYFMEINKFADKSEEEFASMLRRSYTKGSSFVQTAEEFEEPLNVEVPDSFDWRTKGAVTEVKNQGLCAGCWAFSAAGVAESQYFIKTQKLVNFSPQQIIDCANNTKYPLCSGCVGGMEQEGLCYIRDNGIESDIDYPFTERDGKCKYNEADIVTKLDKVVKIPSKNATALKIAVYAYGPTTVAVDASKLQLYGGGIYESTECDGSWLNHAMINVGYGTENGIDFWIIKNSFGADFGEEGYIRYKRGVDMCGIESDTAYVEMSAPKGSSGGGFQNITTFLITLSLIINFFCFLFNMN